MKTFVFCAAIAAMTLIGVAQDQQVVPKSINYQGRLADAQGEPIGGVEGGVFRLRFQLFPVVAEGEALWAEERDVVVINGIFNVALGAAGGDPVGEVPADLAGVFSAPERYLQVTVVSGPGITAEQTLMPRQQLQSVPFTFMAQNAERAAVATLAESLIPELAKALNPPGTIIAYAGQVTDTGGLIEPVPGYLLCNGAVINGTVEEGKFSNLVSVLGQSWGVTSDSGVPRSCQIWQG